MQMAVAYYQHLPLCGCWYPVQTVWGYPERKYLPQVGIKSHTNILATTSRTSLTQTFINDATDKLSEICYTFPLYDGVSVVGFKCTIGSRVIIGKVKEKQEARTEYNEAVARGESAGLFEQLPEASDVFTTRIGNVPAKEKVVVEITYLGELKHDAETDGSRFTIPTVIAPRYGSVSDESAQTLTTNNVNDMQGIQITVDVSLEEGSVVRGLQSPSHPIAVTMGRISSIHEDSFNNNNASATLTLGSTQLDKDFVVVIWAKGQDTPRALLETHPTISNQRALMTTLVPKFNLPNISPELVFVVDRSGSMEGKIGTLVKALRIFLKSLPLACKFNICSFGSRHSTLFKKSKTYDQSSLKEALKHIETFDANFGGTEMLEPIKATVKNRYKDLPLEVMILTDGEIWDQESLFSFINSQEKARFFSLGIGDGASSALVEGIARAGNGFAQFVGENESMDKRVVRMLKGALTPHIMDYTIEVKYSNDSPDKMTDDDFEIVESFQECSKTVLADRTKVSDKKPISLFDTAADEQPTNQNTNRYADLPDITVPKVLQTPHKIPSLFSFNRTTVYLLLGPDACPHNPKSVVLRGSSEHGLLELEIPIQDVGSGEKLHQLAAKKAVHELEQGRGWIAEAKSDGQLLKSSFEGKWDLLVEREAVRLGVQYQVGGKWCSFVATENGSEVAKERGFLQEDEDAATLHEAGGSRGMANPGSTGPLFARMAPGTSHQSSRSVAKSGMSLRKRSPLGFFAAKPPPPPPAPAMAAPGTYGSPSPVAFQMCQSQGIVERGQQPNVAVQCFGGTGVAPAPDRIDCRREASGPIFSKKEKSKVSKALNSGSEPIGSYHSPKYDMMDVTLQEQSLGQSQISESDKMTKLISLQEFDGAWDTSTELLELLGLTKDQIQVSGRRSSSRVNATAFSISWLEVKMSEEEGVWEMVVEKAKNWLENKLGQKESTEILEKARGILM